MFSQKGRAEALLYAHPAVVLVLDLPAGFLGDVLVTALTFRPVRAKAPSSPSNFGASGLPWQLPTLACSKLRSPHKGFYTILYFLGGLHYKILFYLLYLSELDMVKAAVTLWK